MADQRSKFVIEAEAKNFAAVEKQAQGVASALGDTGGIDKLTKAVGAFGAKLGKTVTDAGSLNKAIGEAGNTAKTAGVAGINKMADAMGKVKTQVKAAHDAFDKFTKAQTKAAKEQKRSQQTDSQFGDMIPGIPAAAKARQRRARSDDQFGPTIGNPPPTAKPPKPPKPPKTPGGGGNGDDEDAKKRRGSFTQGFLEGAMPGFRVIDRGPGAVRQAGGIATGSALRNFGSLPLTGGGLGGAIGSTFGALGAPISRLEEMANRRIEFERGQVGMTSLLGGFGMTSGLGGKYAAAQNKAGLTDKAVADRVAAARAQGGAGPNATMRSMQVVNGQLIAPAGTDISNPDFQKRASAQAFALRMQNAGVQRKAAELAGGKLPDDSKMRAEAYSEAQLALGIKPGEIHQRYLDVASGTNNQQAGAAAAAKEKAIADAQRARVRGQVFHASVNPLMSAGRNYAGMNFQQAQQSLAQVSQASGRRADTLNLGQDDLNRMFARQTALGVDAHTQGAFLGAQAVGGTVGGPGKPKAGASSDVDRAITSAMKLGMNGSDLSEYMSRMAGTLDEWKSSGMPLATDSIAKMGTSLQNQFGMTGARAGIAAQSSVRALQNVGREGAQDATDVMALRAYGGMTGPKDMMKSLEHMEELSPEDIERGNKTMSEHFIKSGGGMGNVGARTLQKGWRKYGINMSLRQARVYGTQMSGGKLTDPKDLEMLKSTQSMIDEQQKQAMLGADYQKTAKGASGGIANAMAGHDNNDLMRGGAMVKSVLAMKTASDTTAKAFSDLAKGPITDLAESIKKLVTWIDHSPIFSHGADFTR